MPTTEEKIIKLMDLLSSSQYWVVDLLGKESNGYLLINKAIRGIIDDLASLSVTEELEKENK